MAVVTLALATASVAGAQAFVPPKGEGSVSILFQDIAVKDHYYGTTPVDSGRIRTEVALFDVSYGLTDRVAVSVGLPLVAAKYSSVAPHPLVDLSGPTPRFYGANPLTMAATTRRCRISCPACYNVSRKNFWLTPFADRWCPATITNTSPTQRQAPT
jgi:hypothetical protein